MAKVIIGIHGLGNKPPKRVLERWWRASINEGLRRIGHKRMLFRFGLVYWADCLHPSPLNPAVTDSTNPLYIEEPYLPASGVTMHKPSERRRKVLDYLEKELDRLLLNDDLTVNFRGITNLIIRRYFRDLDAYYQTSCRDKTDSACNPRQAILDHTSQILNSHYGDGILLIGHSMGSIIAYDTLMKAENLVTVDTLVTMGSPLGIPVVIGKIATELSPRPSSGNRLTTPSAVTRRWDNLSDLRDRIAFNYNLSDDYSPNTAGVRVNDRTVVNDYIAHGQANPHKIYGYLRTPEFAGIVDDFLARGGTAPHRRPLDKVLRPDKVF